MAPRDALRLVALPYPVARYAVANTVIGKEIHRVGNRAVRTRDVRFEERAVPTTAMLHMAIQELLDGKAVDWMEKVSDEL